MSDPTPSAGRPPTVAEALTAAQRSGLSRLDAQLLLADLLGCGRTWLLGHDDASLDRDQLREWTARMRRRADGEPVAYLLGRKEFFGLMLHVDRSVLVPRPDTEIVVAWANDILAERPAQLPPAEVVDLGSGSGAIALALKASQAAGIRVTATDASTAALVTAAANGRRLGLPVEWRCGDWWAAVADRRFDLAVSNPPYIDPDDRHLAALRYEPASALIAGENGLAALRRIVGSAGDHLNRGGWLLLEHGFDQADAVSRLLCDAGFRQIQTRRDLGGQPRCTGGQWTG